MVEPHLPGHIAKQDPRLCRRRATRCTGGAVNATALAADRRSLRLRDWPSYSAAGGRKSISLPPHAATASSLIARSRLRISASAMRIGAG